MRTYFLTFSILVYMAIALICYIKSTKNQLPPNVLFFAIDDVKPILGFYRDTTTLSPNMDNLTDHGTVFINNHCQEALCFETRSSFKNNL